MMLLFEGEEVVEPFCDLLQTGRIILHILRAAADVSGYVANLDNNTFEAVQIVFDGGIYIGNLLHCLAGATQRINGSRSILVITAVKQGIDSRQRNLDILGMRKGTLQLPQFLVFARLGFELVELVELEAEVILIALPLCQVLLRLFEPATCLGDADIKSAILPKQFGMVGYGIDDAQLEGGILEQQIAMLRVNIQQSKGNLPEDSTSQSWGRSISATL